jgi:cobalt/nickel transport system permease protein
MMRAAALRAPGGRGIPPRRFGSMVGHLLLRTLDRAQRIHLAMSCRGFEGEVPLLRPLRLRLADAAFVAGWVAFFVAVRVFRLPERLGQWSAGAWS